jgi:peptidoglycan/LPS O-acetylase OafA/YrhL
MNLTEIIAWASTLDPAQITVLAVFGVGIPFAALVGWLSKMELREGPYAHLDGLRAIAALLVVCSHYSKSLMVMMGTTDFPPVVTAFGDIGVQIFFCLTGFLFTHKALEGPVEIPKFIASRVRRIVPLYLVCMTAGILLVNQIRLMTPGHESFHLVDVLYAYGTGFTGYPVGNVSGVALNGVMGQVWTLHWEWMFYLCVPFLAAILAVRSWTVALVVFVVGCAVYQSAITGKMWLFFIPGVVSAIVARWVKIGALAQFVLLAIGAYAFWSSITGALPSYGTKELALCAIGFPALLFGHKWVLSIRPLRILGEVSYSIYLVHLLVAGVFWFIVNYISPESFGLQQPKFELAAVVGPWLFPVAFLTYALIERPFMRAKKTAKADPPASAVSA